MSSESVNVLLQSGVSWDYFRIQLLTVKDVPRSKFHIVLFQFPVMSDDLNTEIDINENHQDEKNDN
jgi:hypothetical protein